MLDKVLEIAKRKSDGADVFISKTKSNKITYVADESEMISSDETNKIGLRLVKNGKIGIANAGFNNLDPTKLVDKALLNAKYGPKCFFEMPKMRQDKNLELYDGKTSSLSMEDMKSFIGKEMDRIKKGQKEALMKSSISLYLNEYQFANSEGIKHSRNSTSVGYYVGGSRKKEGDFLNIFESFSKRKFDGDFKFPADEAIKYFLWSKNIVKIDTGRYEVYISSNVMREIIGTVTFSLNGKNVFLKNSYLKDSLDKKILDSRISIVEDPFIEWRSWSRVIDNEGVPTERKDLIKKGVVEKFYYDLQTAGKAGTTSTGNGSRGFKGQAAPSLSNVIMSGGKYNEDEIISKMKNGLYIQNTMGGFTGNPATGDMSVQNLLAFKVENGKVVGRVKDTMSYFNVFEILKSNVVEISKDRKWEGNKLLPGILFKNISIAAEE